MSLYLGIDPSTRSTGYAVMDQQGDLLEEGIVTPQKTRQGKATPIQERLGYIAPVMEAVMDRYDITVIGSEEQHQRINPKTLKDLCYLSGMLMSAAHRRGIPFVFYHPSSWRKTFNDKGKWDKDDAVAWVNETYDLELKKNQHDLAEGIAIAYHTMIEHERRDAP